jgi:hypothetical protein
LGDFRKTFEPLWNPSISSLQSGQVSDRDKFIVAAYMANLMTCTPAWRRLLAQAHNSQLVGCMSFAKRIKQEHGGHPDLPVEAIELVEHGKIMIEIDTDYIRAMVTRQLLDLAWVTYNQDWTVLANDTDQPFITSDNPVALSNLGMIGAPATRFLPITPRLCLSVAYGNIPIRPLNGYDPSRDLPEPSQGRTTFSSVSTGGAKRVNRSVAACAENLVFSSLKSKGIHALVAKYAKYRLDVDCLELLGDDDDCLYQGLRLRVCEVNGTK